MLFPIIKIRDKDCGKERIVGTNSHDSLYVDWKTGGIQYLNLQCCEGTKKLSNDSAYEFVGKNNEYSPYPVIEFLTPEELGELYIKETKAACQKER